MNALCLLPHDFCVVVYVRFPHPCGGWYTADAWVYGARGRVGMFGGWR